MLSYVIRRILLAIPVVTVVAVVVFALLYLTPGDPALVIAGDQATPDQVEHIRAALGLNQPPYFRFFNWLGHILRGDFGESIFTGQPVLAMLGQRLEPTLSLMIASLLLAIGVGVPLGVLAAWRPGGIADKLVTLLSTLGFAIPSFVVGYGLAFVFASQLHLFPVEGFSPISDGLWPFLRSIILPAVTLAQIYAALIAAVTRASMSEVLSQDYIRTATAKGVGQVAILFRHALRNASIPVVTVVGSGLVTLISAAVVTENVFAVPGIGRLTTDAILHRDYPIIQAVVLLSSTAYVVINLGVDLIYTVLDPRIRY